MVCRYGLAVCGGRKVRAANDVAAHSSLTRAGTIFHERAFRESAQTAWTALTKCAINCRVVRDNIDLPGGERVRCVADSENISIFCAQYWLIRKQTRDATSSEAAFGSDSGTSRTESYDFRQINF